MAAFGADLGHNNGSASSATLAITTTAAVPSGAKIVVHVFNFDAAVTDSSIAGGSLTWVREGRANNGSFREAIYYADAPSGLASSSTITITYSAGTGDRAAIAYYITSVATGAAGETFASSTTGAGSSWTSSKTTTNANVILCGGGAEDGSGTATHTPNANYTETAPDFVSATSTECWVAEYRVVSSTATYTMGGSFSPAGSTSIGAMVGYVDSGGAATKAPVRYSRTARNSLLRR